MAASSTFGVAFDGRQAGDLNELTVASNKLEKVTNVPPWTGFCFAILVGQLLGEKTVEEERT